MKFWVDVQRRLESGEKTLRRAYEVMMSMFGENVFAEKLNGAVIEKTTYNELASLADAVKGGVIEHGAKKGDIVGIDMPNSPLWVACFWGILRTGCVPLLINTMHDNDTKEKVIANCRCRLVLSDGSSKTAEAVDCTGWKSEGQLPEDDWADTFVLTTTGTTGMPKTVVHSGEGVVRQALYTSEAIKRNRTILYNSRGEIKIMAFLPFYHIFGLVATLLWFGTFGRTFIFLNDNAPDTIRYACKRHKVTHFFAIPLVWNSVADNILREADRMGKRAKLEKALSFSIGLQKVFPRLGMKIARRMFKTQRTLVMGHTLMFLISGGAPLTADARRVMNGMGYSLYNGYGSTEAGIVSVELSKNAKPRMTDSVGVPFNGVSARVEDGMLFLDGGGMFIGTIVDGELVPREDKFFPTNDNANIDGAGRIYIRGRKDDIIISDNGENVAPDDIEEKIGSLPCDAYTVVGLDHGGKTVNSLVLACADERRPFAIAAAYTAIDKLPQAVRPHAVYVCDALPTMLGKIRRSEVRRLFAEDRARFSTGERSAAAEMKEVEKALVDGVRAVFAEVLKLSEKEVGEQSDFFALGGTSLDYFAIISNLNDKYKITLDYSADPPCLTPATFAAAIASKLENR